MSIQSDLVQGVIEAVFADHGFQPDEAQTASMAKTPARWVKAMGEMTSGYKLTGADVLTTIFEGVSYSDEMIVLKDIDFTSLCEHHLLPFNGKAHVAYVPGGNAVVGLSKLARLVDVHAKRFQVQERMTWDIAQDLNDNLNPRGVGVVVEAHHSCMGCRGVRKPGAKMVTSALLGVFRESEVRDEFLQFTRPNN